MPNETEKAKNQVCKHLFALLVCFPGLPCRWSHEIPDLG
jgi:hypothetical protein